MSTDELFARVNEAGDVIGTVRRGDAHGNPELMHAVVHCVVVNQAGDLLLQLRSMTKDVQPGKWDTSVGGHVGAGEGIEEALVRELGEEIGLRTTIDNLTFLYRYVMRSDIETELVHTYVCTSDGPFYRQVEEIDALRFWTRAEIDSALGTGVFTPNFEDEYRRFVAWQRSDAACLS